MDIQQEDKVQEYNNPNSGSLEPNTNDENTCIENQNNNSGGTSCFENNNQDQKDVRTSTVSSTIIGKINSPQKPVNNPENPVDISMDVNVSEGKNPDQKDKTSVSPSPQKTDNPENIPMDVNVPESGKKQEEEGKLKLPGEVLMETGEVKKTEEKSPLSSPADKNMPKKTLVFSALDGLKKYSSDDESVDSSEDSSSDSSTSSSSSSSGDESSSSEDDEMDEEGENDNEKVGLPKKVVTVTISPLQEKPEAKKEETPTGAENGKPRKILHFPATYRDNDDDSSDDSSSDSSSSTSSETEDNEDDHTQRRPNRPPPKERDSDGEEKMSRPRVKGEIFPEELPALEDLNINIDDNVDLQMLGKITSVIRNIAVAHAEFTSPIDQDSMVFLKDRTCIGKVHDIIGPVREPFYTIILDKNHTTIALDTEIYCAPEEKEYTNYVFVNDLKNLKGSDASWEHDVEPPAKFLDYSDDEQERAMKKRGKSKNTVNEDANDDPNDKNGRSRNRIRPGSSSTGPSNTRNWRKRGQNGSTNSNNPSKDGSQKSMFACSTQWPPSNGEGNFPSWPQPSHPQYQQLNNPSYQEECNRLNQMIWPPNNSGQNSSADNRAPFRPPSSFPPRQPNMGSHPTPFSHPPNGNSFNTPPPNQPWSQGQQWPPQGSQGQQWPPQGSQGSQWPPQGSQGPQWTQQGSQGPQWTQQGSQGPQGPQGSQWPQQGSQGPQGPQGSQWPQQGSQGLQGPQGSQWPQQGSQGPQWPPQGPQGSQGPQWPPQGSQGSQWPPQGQQRPHQGFQSQYGFMRNPSPRFSQPPQFPGRFP